MDILVEDELLETPCYQNNLVHIVIDEADIYPKWYKSAVFRIFLTSNFRSLNFRPKFGEMMNIIGKINAPVLVMSGTWLKGVPEFVFDLFGLDYDSSTSRVRVPLDNPKVAVFVEYGPQTSKLSWAVENFTQNKNSKIIIYCANITDIERIRLYFRKELGSEFFLCPGADEESFRAHRVLAYYADGNDEDKLFALHEFLKKEGQVRILITTVAACRGLQAQHLDYVVIYHWNGDVAELMQQLFRVGRLGQSGKHEAIIYLGGRCEVGFLDHKDLSDKNEQVKKTVRFLMSIQELSRALRQDLTDADPMKCVHIFLKRQRGEMGIH